MTTDTCDKGQCMQAVLDSKIPFPKTVKEIMQHRVEFARKQLAEALTNQAKAEILGINDWPYEETQNILHGYTPF